MKSLLRRLTGADYFAPREPYRLLPHGRIQVGRAVFDRQGRLIELLPRPWMDPERKEG